MILACPLQTTLPLSRLWVGMLLVANFYRFSEWLGPNVHTC